MDTTLIFMYCLVDEMLQASGHHEPPQRAMSDAEVMTTALVSVRFFRGNFATARLFLQEQGYIPRMLSKRQFNRRLQRISGHFERLFQGLAACFKQQETNAEGIYLIDSCPVEVCDNIRIHRCRIYPAKATEGAFRGDIASKKRFFYGLKLFLMTTSAGYPVEVFFPPGVSAR